MGNITFIVPIENKDKLNTTDISKYLRNEYPQYQYEVDPKFYSIRVSDKNDDLITNIYIDMECYIIDFDEDIKYLKENEGFSNITETLIKELKELKEMKPDLEHCIQTTYGKFPFNDDKNNIDFFLSKIFAGGYIFDEGIHPEFIGPSYVREKKKKFKFFRRK